MNNSEMFKKAHEIARSIVDVVGNYSIAFKFALKQVWAVVKASEKKINHYEMAVMINCSSYSSERRAYGIPASITGDEIDDATQRLKPFLLDGTLSARQYAYAVWYFLLGKKTVERCLFS